MIDNGIGIFAGIVESQTTDPYPILHLSFPESVTFKGIRSATRVAVHEKIDIRLVNSSSPVVSPGFISDISINGCRIELGEDIAEIGDAIELKAEVDIRGVKRSLVVRGMVRSRLDPTDNLEEGVLVSYGLEFSGHSDDELLVIYAYVFSYMAQQDHSST